MAEFPVAAALRTGGTVRFEQMVLRVPSGRDITVMVNATPIRSNDGVIRSFVVTLQDMTPIGNLERQRAEFLGMVSHELRLPLMSIKGSADTLLESGPDLDPAVVRQFSRIIRDQSERMRHMIVDLLDAARIETGTLSVNPEPSPVLAMVDEAKRRRGTRARHLPWDRRSPWWAYLGGKRRDRARLQVHFHHPGRCAHGPRPGWYGDPRAGSSRPGPRRSVNPRRGR